MLPQDERIARLQLARSEGIGPITFRRLLERYGTALRAADAVPELSKRGGRAKPLKLCDRAAAQDEAARIAAMGATLLVSGDDAYPARLATIEDAPITLTVLGNASLLQKQGVAVVGARNASLQGRRFAEMLSAGLGRAGLCVTSGLARGIDTAAHTASIATGTIAVVAGGVDVVYPAENKTLYDDIAARGAIIAENRLGTQPMAQHFPRRNRIISGLSTGVVVVEATLKSGSLITAHMAADQGREVYAVPGHPMDPRSQGPNALLRDGAVIVTALSDILENIARQNDRRVVREATPANTYDAPLAEPAADLLEAARKALFPLLGAVPVPVDELVRETGMPVPLIQTILLEQELAGRLTRHPGNRVAAQYIEYEIDKTASLV